MTLLQGALAFHSGEPASALPYTTTTTVYYLYVLVRYAH